MITDISPLMTPGATVVAAPYAPAGPIIAGTSSTSNDVSVGGVYVFAVDQVGLGFTPGVRVRVAAVANVTAWIEGVVTAFDDINLTIQSDLINGAGIYTGWNISVAGQPGLKGQKGDTGTPGPPGNAIVGDSPFFTGDVRAPTPLQGDNDNTVATTAFVTTAIQFAKIDTILVGNPTLATPPTLGDNDTSVATTGFVQATLAGATSGFAPILNPVFQGDARAVTPPVGDNDTSIATTGWVTASFAPILNPVFAGTPKLTTTPASTDNSTALASTAFVAAATAPLAPKNSPALTGTPTSITPLAASNDTSIATSAFVKTALQSYATIVAPAFQNGPGNIAPSAPTAVPTSFDSTIATTAFVQGAIASLAPLRNPTFTGSPSAPTQQPGSFDSTLATTAYVDRGLAGYQPLSAELTSLAGVTSVGAFYYRSAVGNWLPVEMGANMTFSSGILASAGGGGGTGGIAEAPTDGVYYSRRNATWVGAAIQTDAPSDNANYVRNNAAWVNISGALTAYAPLLNPSFTGTPKSITFAKTDNTTNIATTAFVHSVANDYATLAGPGPAFTGAPSAPTPVPASNDGTLATTAFVQAAVAPLAPINQPTFTGNAKAVTPTAGDNSTSISTTAFVATAIGAIPGIPDGSITYAKIQNISASSRVLGRIAAGAGVTQELAGTDLVTIIDGNLSSLMAPGNWKNFYTDGSGILIPIGVGAAGTSFVGNGAAAAPSWMAWATAAQYAGNSANALLAANAVWAAAALQTLTDAATVTPDFSTGFDFIWTLGATGRTIANATNPKVGQKGIIYLVQDGTGSRTITTWGSNYKFSGGTKPTLSTAAGAVDLISYAVKSGTEIECFFSANMS
jgi:hypothetical protein